MKYQISGQKLDIGVSLQEHVKEKLGEILEKYSMNPTGANIVFSRVRHEFACEITVHLSTGLNIQARAPASDIYITADSAADKIEKQLRRYKRRLRNHHRDRKDPVEFHSASSYVVRAEAEEESEAEEKNISLQPIIIAEMQTRIPKISVGEAVMQMELADSPALVFRNEGTEAINVVYRRNDGHIGWVES